MASIKQLCQKGILLENGTLKYSGGIKDTVEEYLTNGIKTSQNVYFDRIEEAPGNDKIRIRSFEVDPIIGNELNVESGIRITLKFVNYVPDIMLDTTIELSTAENVIVFHTGSMISPDGDSKIGTYTVTFDIPPDTLNTGKYIIRLWFGESQAYVLWGSFHHIFKVENTLSGQGYNLHTLPGVMKPRLQSTCSFDESI